MLALTLGPFQSFTPPTTGAAFTPAQYRELDAIVNRSDIHMVVEEALIQERKKANRAAFAAGAVGFIAAMITGTIAVRMVGRSADIARRKYGL